jgi:hypothetical protein
MVDLTAAELETGWSFDLLEAFSLIEQDRLIWLTLTHFPSDVLGRVLRSLPARQEVWYDGCDGQRFTTCTVPFFARLKDKAHGLLRVGVSIDFVTGKADWRRADDR